MTKDELLILQTLLQYAMNDVKRLSTPECGGEFNAGASYVRGRKDTLEQIIELFSKELQNDRNTL